MLQSLNEQPISLSEELHITLKNRTEERHIDVEHVLRYLHNYNDFKNENEKEEKRLTNSNLIKFIKSTISKTIRREIELFEDEGFRVRNLLKISTETDLLMNT
ncbi:UNVERIFIED_CONTAM: hypothetical protein NCL1_17075 [Trichonephila clavipes]